MGKKPANSNAAATPSRSFWEKVARYAFIVATGAAMTAAGGFSLRAVQRRVAALPGAQLPGRDATITSSPDWVRFDVPKSIMQAAGFRDRLLDLTDRQTLADLGRVFETSPWVARVRLQRSFQRLVIDLEYRKPVLAIPWDSRFCYVDKDAVVLPANDATEEALRRCIVLEGLALRPLPVIGRRIGDSRVQNAARLAAQFDNARDAVRIAVIIVRSTDLQPFSAELITDVGVRLDWPQIASEQETAARITAIQEFVRQHGGIPTHDRKARLKFDSARDGWFLD